MAICKHWVWHWLWLTYSCGCIVAFSVVVAVGVGCEDVHMAERSARVAECSADSAKGSEIFSAWLPIQLSTPLWARMLVTTVNLSNANRFLICTSQHELWHLPPLERRHSAIIYLSKFGHCMSLTWGIKPQSKDAVHRSIGIPSFRRDSIQLKL